MSTEVKEQLNEVYNILSTLTETSSHLATLAEADELEQSIFIFSSLIEGLEAVFNVLPTFDIDVTESMKQTEQALLYIAKSLENNALHEVTEQTNGSLHPAIENMTTTYKHALETI